MSIQKRGKIPLMLVSALLLLCLASYGQEGVYTERMNIQQNQSGTYEWQVKNPGSINSLKATGSVSTNGTAKVFIEKDGQRVLLFDSTRQLFDVNIHVLPEYKKVFKGDQILAEIILFNLRGFGSGNVSVEYSIKDSRGNLIAVEEEKVYIETQAKFIRNLEIPDGIKTGIYTAFVSASSGNILLGSGSDNFEVSSKYGEPREIKVYLYGFIAVLSLIAFSAFGFYWLKSAKRKRNIADIRGKIPEEKKKKLESELKALEAAYKSGFISKESYDRDKKRLEKSSK